MKLNRAHKANYTCSLQFLLSFTDWQTDPPIETPGSVKRSTLAPLWPSLDFICWKVFIYAVFWLTDRQTNEQMDRASYRDARMHLKISSSLLPMNTCMQLLTGWKALDPVWFLSDRNHRQSRHPQPGRLLRGPTVSIWNPHWRKIGQNQKMPWKSLRYWRSSNSIEQDKSNRGHMWQKW